MTHVLRATVTRGESSWIASVLDLPDGQRATVMGRTWKQLRELTQEACEHHLTLPKGSVVIDLRLEDPELQELIEEAKAAKAMLRNAQSYAQTTLVRALRRLGRMATVRDMAEMLDYSHQYVARKAPKDTLKEAPGDTPEDWARMLFSVAGMRTPASSAELAREARCWLDSFPDDPEFTRKVAASHRALIQEAVDRDWGSPEGE
jgi:hypothetical protein